MIGFNPKGDCCTPGRRCEYSDECREPTLFAVFINVPPWRSHWHMCKRHAEQVDP